MELIIGKYGFISWWAFIMPQRLWDAGYKFMQTAADIFAIKEMAQHIGESIFQDPTWQGRLIGIGIRIMRIIFGVFAESIFVIMTLSVVVLWYMFPIIAVYGVAKW